MMKKIISLLTMLALLAGSLCGCRGDGGGTAGPGKDETKIVFYARMFEEYANKHLEEQVKTFNEDKTDGVYVDMKFFDKDDAYMTALEAARSTSSQLDLYVAQYADLYNSIAGGYAEPLDDYFTQEDWDDLYPYALDMVTYNGKHYAFPWLVEPGCMFFYRKDMLEAAGVDKVPATWDELLTACAAVKSQVPPNGYPLGLPAGAADLSWSTWGLQQNTTGGLAVSDDWMTSRMGEPGWKDLCEFFYNVASKGYSSVDSLTPLGYEDLVDALCEGKLAMSMGGSWSIARIMYYYPDMADKIGVGMFPTKTGDPSLTSSTNGGWCYVVSSDSTHKEQVTKFLKWLFTEDTERTAEYFTVTYQSKQPTSQKVNSYLNGLESGVNPQWVEAMHDIADKGIPEPNYPFDISSSVGLLLSSMQIDSSKQAFSSLFAGRMKTAVDSISTVMSRSSYTPNPRSTS